MLRAWRAWIGFEFGEAAQREVDLARRTFRAKATHRAIEIVRQMALVKQAAEGEMRVEIARHDGRFYLFARFECDARDCAIVNKKLRDGRADADLRVCRAGRLRNRV